MGSFAQATADLERFSKMAGVKARRDPKTLSATGSAVTDNLLLVQDSRSTLERVADAYFVETATAPVAQAGRYSWVPMETSDAGATGGITYWDADNIVEISSAA